MLNYIDKIGGSHLDKAFMVMQRKRNDALSKTESDDKRIRDAWCHLKNAAPYCSSGHLKKRFISFYADYADLIKESTVYTEMMELYNRFY